jgi:hypothetical protein
MSSHHTPHHVGATTSEVHVWQDNQDIIFVRQFDRFTGTYKNIRALPVQFGRFQSHQLYSSILGLDLSHAAKDRLPGHSGACHAGFQNKEKGRMTIKVI